MLEANVIVALEVLGLIAVAAGATFALLPFIGLAAVAVGGVVVLGGVLLSSKVGGRR